MSMDHTPLEGVRVAASGFDRPEGHGGAQNAAPRLVSDDAGISRPSGGSGGLDRRTAENLAWLASWWSGWCTDNDQTLPDLAKLGGFLIGVQRALLGVSDAAS